MPQVPLADGLWLIVPLVILAALAVLDIRTRKLPNAIVLGLLVLGLVHAALDGGLLGAAASLAGAAAGLALLFLQHAKGIMGAGDVKLLAAIGAWTGPLGAVMVLLIASVLGGILALVALATIPSEERAQIRQNLLNVALNRGTSIPEPSKISKSRGIPFGVSLAAAASFIIVEGLWR